MRISFIHVAIFHPATRGVRPRMGGTFGWGAQRPRCRCLAERVPQRHAWPSADKRALHGFHQHNMWGVHIHTLEPKLTSHYAFVTILVVCFFFIFTDIMRWPFFCLQCWIIQTKRAPCSSWYFCFLPVTAIRCSASSACCPQWLHMLTTA